MVNIDFFLFCLFSFSGLLSACFVILLPNAVHSVLFLVLTFFNFSCLLILIGAEFFSFLLIIVYVGAIAVLFLFVIMMLNLKLQSGLSLFYTLIPITFVILLLFLNQFLTLLNMSDLLRFCFHTLQWTSWINTQNFNNNVVVLGSVLYSYYSFVFLAAGFILLVAMIGAIVLTMHFKISTKAQSIELQVLRNSKDAIKFINLRGK